MKLFDQSSSYEDYKYVMADTGFIYFGAKYTWEELGNIEETPFKMKTIMERYILPETLAENTLESELYYNDGTGRLFLTLQQLKAKVKFCRMGKKGSFEQSFMSLSDFVKISPEEKKRKQFFIQELGISKLALMMFMV